MDSRTITKGCYLPTSSVFDIVTRQGTGRTGIKIPAGDFLPSQIAYSGSGAHPACHFIGTVVLLRIEAGETSIRPLTSI